MITKQSIQRVAGLTVGAAVHGLFAFTVYRLFFFLQGTGPSNTPGPLWPDALLALQFGVFHSLLLLPSVRTRLTPWISPAFYGLFYCTATCGTLLLAICNWHVGSWAIWQLEGWPRLAVQTAFSLTWIGVFYSVGLTGYGYQTGFTPWWHWVRGLPVPRREFKPRGAYHILRHPLYLSFLGLLWFTPDMTVDRAVLTGVWTIYVFVGSHLKDRRLAYYIGHPYRAYQARVPGYPGMLVGPLARVAFAGEGTTTQRVPNSLPAISPVKT